MVDNNICFGGLFKHRDVYSDIFFSYRPALLNYLIYNQKIIIALYTVLPSEWSYCQQLNEIYYLSCSLLWPAIMFSSFQQLHWAAGRRSRRGTSSSCSSQGGERRSGWDSRFGWQGANRTLWEGGLWRKERIWSNGVQRSDWMPGISWEAGWKGQCRCSQLVPIVWTDV